RVSPAAPCLWPWAVVLLCATSSVNRRASTIVLWFRPHDGGFRPSGGACPAHQPSLGGGARGARRPPRGKRRAAKHQPLRSPRRRTASTGSRPASRPSASPPP